MLSREGERTGGKGLELPRSTLLPGETVHRLHWVEKGGNFRILSCSQGSLSTDYTGWKGMGTSAFYPVPRGACPQTTPGGKGWELPNSILFPVHRLHRVERDGNFRVLSCSLSTNYNRRKGMGTSAFYPVRRGRLSTNYNGLTKVSELLGDHWRGQ